MTKLISTLIDLLYEQEIRDIHSIINEAQELQLKDETKQILKDIGLTFGRGYIKWIILKLTQGLLKEEDIYKYKDFFKYYEQGKKLGHFTYNDIFKYKTSEEFEIEAIKSHEKIIGFTGDEKTEASKALVSPKEIQTLQNIGIEFLGLTPDGYQCFKIPKKLAKNNEAFEAQKNILGRCQGREIGSKISICTMGGIGHFNSYLNRDDLYVFFNLNDPFSPIQFHYESGSFLNKNDQRALDRAPNEHIINFFKFLEEKNEKPIPFKIKIKYIKDEFTIEDINKLSLPDKTEHFPEHLTDKDKKEILTSTDENVSKLRKNYINNIVEKKNNFGEKFKEISPFDVVGENVAFAITFYEHQYFIDKEGNILTNLKNKVDPYKFTSDGQMRVYINSVQNKIKFNRSDYVSLLNKYSPYVIYYEKRDRFYKKEDYGFINMNGELDITGVDPKKLYYTDVEARYFNILLNTDIFYSIEEWDKYAPDIALAKTKNGEMFIDVNGKPSTKGLDPNKIAMNDSFVSVAVSLRTYFNQIQDKYDFRTVHSIGNNTFVCSLAKKPNIYYMFNEKGEMSTENIKETSMLRDFNKVLVPYLNTIQNKIKILTAYRAPVEELIYAFIYNPKTDSSYDSNYVTDIFIDFKGNPSVKNINTDDISKNPAELNAYNNTIKIINGNYKELNGPHHTVSQSNWK